MHNHNTIDFADLNGTIEKVLIDEIDGIDYTIEYEIVGATPTDFNILSIDPVPQELNHVKSIHHLVKCEMEDNRNEF